jgi:hypothetical protein
LLSPVAAGPTILAVTSSGRQWTVAASGFEPGEEVTGTMYSSPLDLGQQAADANGSVSFTWTMPADVTPGQHTVILAGQRSGTVEQAITVGAGGVLATTGAGVPGGLVGAGLFCLVAGAVVVLGLTRRLRRAN